MAAAKVAVTIDADLLREVDQWVASGEFPNRSRAFQAGLLHLRGEHAKRNALLRELGKLDRDQERALAEEWLAGETAWPKY